MLQTRGGVKGVSVHILICDSIYMYAPPYNCDRDRDSMMELGRAPEVTQDQGTSSNAPVRTSRKAQCIVAAIVIALLNYIPYVGSLLAVVFPVVLSLATVSMIATISLASA